MPNRYFMATVAGALLAAMIVNWAPAQDVRQQDKYTDQCNDDDPSIALPACTALIAIAIKKGDRNLQIEALQVRSNVKSHNGDNEGGIQDLDEALKLAPKDKSVLAEIYNDRGTILTDLRRFDEAIADLDRAFSFDRTEYRAVRNKALAYREAGDYDRAIVIYTEIINSRDRNAKFEKNDSRAARGEAYRLKGDLNAALRDLDQALQESQSKSLPYISRGAIHRYLGNLPAAFADFGRALRVPKLINAPAIYAERGLTFEKQRDFTRAKEDYERALTYPPFLSDTTPSAQQTARARLAALASGAPQPQIPSVPAVRPTPISLPTPPAVVPAPATNKPIGRRAALVIGNSAYKNVAALPNPKRDADSVAATLRNIGFETVIIAADNDKAKLTEALRNFANEAEKADWAMVYYAGHGIEVNGINYLIPVDAKLAADRDVQFEAIPLDQVMVSVEGAKKLKLVVLDACRDNPFAPAMRKTTPTQEVANRSTAGGVVGARSIGRGLGEVKVSGATLVVYAAKHGQTALDGEGGNSPFAVAMVQRLATPGVEINKIFRLVRDDVMEATAGRQEPFTYGSLPGREDFFFVTK